MNTTKLFLFTLKKIVYHELIRNHYFDGLVKLNPEENDLSKIYKIDLLNQFENDFLFIEDTILNCPKKVDLNVFIYHIQDFIKEILDYNEDYLYHFKLLQQSHWRDQDNSLIWPYGEKIEKTKEYYNLMFFGFISEKLSEYQEKLNRLLSKYNIIQSLKIKNRIKTLQLIAEDDKICITDFELFMAAVNICIRKGGVWKNINSKKPTNKELFNYLEQHFTFKGRYNSISKLKRSTIETNFSIIASNEASFKKYLQYEEKLLSLLI